MRSAPHRRRELDLVVEHARDALHDRQAEPQPARDLGALIQAVEFLEDRALLGLRDAEPGIVDVDAQVPRRRRQPTSTRPSACI